MNDRDSCFQDHSGMEDILLPELAYPEGVLDDGDDMIDQNYAVSDTAALIIADQGREDGGINTASDNITGEHVHPDSQARDDQLDPEMFSDFGFQPTGSVPTPIPFPVVPNYVSDNTMGQLGGFGSSLASGFATNNFQMGNNNYMHSTGFNNAAPRNNPTHAAPVADMQTALAGTSSYGINIVPTNAAHVNSTPLNTVATSAPPTNVGPINSAAMNNGPLNAAPPAYQGHPIDGRSRRHRTGTRGCHAGSNGIDRPDPPEPLPIPAPPAGAPPGVIYPLPLLDYVPPRAVVYGNRGQKRLHCNRCTVVKSREDELRFHLRDVHYKAKYKWIHYGNHEQGLYYFGVDQSNMDCPKA